SVAVTLTPGSTALVSSTAMPMIDPCCAEASELTRTADATSTATRSLLTGPSFGIRNEEFRMWHSRNAVRDAFQLPNSQFQIALLSDYCVADVGWLFRS